MVTQVFFGWGFRTKLRELLDSMHCSRVTLLTGTSSLRQSGHLHEIEDILEKLDVHTLSGIPAMPTLPFLENLIESESHLPLPDAIVGVGGGSVLDSMKCLSTMLLQRTSLNHILTDTGPPIALSIPCIAIPTTAGTGSEVTNSCTIWDLEAHEKYSLHGDWMYPRYAILDPELTLSLPPRVTATTGLDALAHGIEAAYSIRSTKDSDEHAFRALDTIIADLEKAVSDGSNRFAREKLLRGSLESGLAISRTSTAAAHSASYPLSIYYRIPHGHAVGLLVPEFLVYNSGVREFDCQDPRGVPFVKGRGRAIASALGFQSEVDVREHLRQLMARIGLETKLRDLGVTDLDLIAKGGLNPTRVVNQPRQVTEQSLRSILERVYD
jgi:alcohol dehydrogenase class IV